MATISLCMIVKNEEAVLARCLDSIRAGVDEIIIADTGSSDNTKEIAAHYTDKIYDFAWIDDFSAARNFAFSKAMMDFVMWLDADDVFLPEDLAAFLALKETLTEAVDAVALPYHTAFDEAGNPVFSFYRTRLVRRSMKPFWRGRVHEALGHGGHTLYAAPAVTHRSIKTGYSDRNLRIYEKQRADGEPFCPRDLFYYGRELYYHRKYGRAKEELEAFLSEGKGWNENNIEACKILSYCYRDTGDLPAAFQALTRSFCYDTPRAEICCELGALWMRLKKYQTAVFWYELALQLPQNETSGAFVSKDCYGYLPCIQLCVCYDKLGEHEKAEAYNRKAGIYRPSSPAYQHNLAYFAARAAAAHTQDSTGI